MTSRSTLILTVGFLALAALGCWLPAASQVPASQIPASQVPASQVLASRAPRLAQAVGNAPTPPRTTTSAAAPGASTSAPGAATSAPATSTSAPAAAAPSVYNIELIIFRANSAQGGAENWSAEANAGTTNAGDEASSGSSQLGRFVSALPGSAYQLNDLESKLRSSGAYTPIAHVAWSQTASAWGTRAGFPLQKLGVEVPGLSGNVFLERGQFLHLGMTLGYAMPSPPAGLGAGPGTTFTINESRRIKFYERNYYDHPAFGVIALVTPAQGSRPPGR